jgi:hypothetical protein
MTMFGYSRRICEGKGVEFAFECEGKGGELALDVKGRMVFALEGADGEQHCRHCLPYRRGLEEG